MASSSRKLVITNLILALLISGMFWFMFNGGSFDLLNFGTTSSGAKQTASSSPTISTQGLSAQDAQAIEALQKQLEAEKRRAASARAQLQARSQNSATQNKQQEKPKKQPSEAQIKRSENQQSAPAATGETLGGLNVEQQTQLIAQMIQAQLKGAEAENMRLKQALAQKDQEIAAVKKKNSEITKKLDNSAQVLLAKLVANGDNISSGDQNYLNAMQDLEKDTASSQQSANLSETDLINRVEIMDSGDSGTIAAKLRTTVDELMEENKAPKPTDNANMQTPAAAGQVASIENLVNSLMSGNELKKTQKQFQADSQYLDSLDPMEKERQNETRWVTVRQGDTLFDIAKRVYNDGKLYNKLYEANPQVLSHPDLIKTGQRLRVPL